MGSWTAGRGWHELLRHLHPPAILLLRVADGLELATSRIGSEPSPRIILLIQSMTVNVSSPSFAAPVLLVSSRRVCGAAPFIAVGLPRSLTQVFGGGVQDMDRQFRGRPSDPGCRVYAD